jgi:hypothetical protein
MWMTSFIVGGFLSRITAWHIDCIWTVKVPVVMSSPATYGHEVVDIDVEPLRLWVYPVDGWFLGHFVYA